MGKRQKYTDDIKEKARALLSVGGGTSYVARQLNIPEATVRLWKKTFDATSPADGDGLEELRRKNKEQFIKDAWQDIKLAGEIIHKRLYRAAKDEERIDKLMMAVAIDSELGPKQKKEIMSKLLDLKISDVGKISTVLGVLYDKQALACKDATTVLESNFKFEDL